MNTYLSDKLKVMSFICIVLVVWIHTYYIEGESFQSTMFLMNFWGNGICLLAVPMFYVISGYLFFIGTKEIGISSVFRKQKRRIRTLLIPYILANIISICFYGSLKVLTSLIPALKSAVNVNLLDRAQGGILNGISFCFWDGPIAFQMWFVRDLIILIAFTPIFYYALRSFVMNLWTTVLGIIICVIIIFYHFNPFIWALGWFIMGGVLSMSDKINVSETKRLRWVGVLLVLIVLMTSVINARYAIGVNTLFIRQDLITLLGVPGGWILYDIIFRNRLLCMGKWKNILFSSTFFIYLIHEPFLNIFKKLPLLLASNAFCINVSYILCPILFICVSLLFGQFLKRNYPKFYNLYTGGR